MTSRRAGAGAVAFTVLAVGLMLLMIMFAARSGPQRIIHGTLVDPSVRPIDPSYSFPALACPRASASTPGETSPPSRRACRSHVGNGQGFFHDNAVFRTLGTMIKVALLVLVLWGGYRLLARAKEWLVRRRRPPRPERVDFDVLDDPEPLAREMRADAADQLALLLGGTPRNAIVACWDRFEEQAERVHAARKDWETSSEFTLRLLERVAADSAAVNRLESLYHEARFSTHAIDEAHRRAAVEALDAIHLSLGAKAVPG